MSVDHSAGAARRWAQGATIVYRPIVGQLLATRVIATSGNNIGPAADNRIR